MFRIYTNHPHHAFAVDDFALVAHLLDRRTDFHRGNLCLFIAVCNSAAIEISAFVLKCEPALDADYPLIQPGT